MINSCHIKRVSGLSGPPSTHEATHTSRFFEVPDGFEVTSFPNGVGFASRRKLFSHKDLLAQDYGSHHHKPHLLHKHAAALSPYQDLFRAIGYELVDAGAYSIILDELDDGFLLTYQYYNPESGFMLHKRQIQLKRDDTRLILSVAIGRRSRR